MTFIPDLQNYLKISLSDITNSIKGIFQCISDILNILDCINVILIFFSDVANPLHLWIISDISRLFETSPI